MNLPVLTYRRFCTRAYSSSLLLMGEDPQDNSVYHQRDEERIPVLRASLAATGSRRLNCGRWQYRIPGQKADIHLYLGPIVLPFLVRPNRRQVRIRKNQNEPMRTVFREWSRQ